MKTFAIKDELDKVNKPLAYLIYYEKEKHFYIEIEENADPWRLPMLLSTFAERGETTVNSYWSKIWVSQRIIPSDRQNLGQILKENDLDAYDEFSLLEASLGRCAQDSFYLENVASNELPKGFVKRYRYKVEDVIPLDKGSLLVFFRDGCVKKCDVMVIPVISKRISAVVGNEKKFNEVAIQTGGYGVSWGENIDISDENLYRYGKNVPLTINDFRNFIRYRAVNTAEAAELLECSRQNIEDLVRRGKLTPVKTAAKGKLFLKSDIDQRKW
jgi:Protein of unknown function (DUF2442).